MTRVYADTSKIIDLTRIDAADVKTPIDALDTQLAKLVFTGGRLTLSSTQAVPTSDLSAQSTLYYLPYAGSPTPGLISLWNGSTSGIETIDFTGATVSLGLGSTSPTTLYDVFGYLSSGDLALEILAWSSSGAGTSARATGLAWANGMVVKAGDATRRYLGTMFVFDTNSAYDTAGGRDLWNAYNRAPRTLARTEGTTSWTYATNTWRATNNNASGSTVSLTTGLDGVLVNLMFKEAVSGTTITAFFGIGIDGSNPTTWCTRDSTGLQTVVAQYASALSAGYHTATAMENVSAGTATIYGSTSRYLLSGFIMA